MPVSIDPRFSLYSHVDMRNRYNIFSERRPLLARWCKSIEDNVVDRKLDTEVYAGFQQLRFITPILERYRRIAGVARGVWVFGLPDPVTLDGMQRVELQPGDELVREWFLIVNHPRFARALIAQETSPAGTPHRERMFQGVLTNDHEQVAIFYQALVAALKRREEG